MDDPVVAVALSPNHPADEITARHPGIRVMGADHMEHEVSEDQDVGHVRKAPSLEGGDEPADADEQEYVFERPGSPVQGFNCGDEPNDSRAGEKGIRHVERLNPCALRSTAIRKPIPSHNRAHR